MRPSPMVQLMGGGALFTVAAVVWGLRAPFLVRCAGVGLFVLAGLANIGLAVHAAFFRKTPAPPRRLRKRDAADDACRPGAPHSRGARGARGGRA